MINRRLESPASLYYVRQYKKTKKKRKAMGHSWATESAPCRVPLGSREGLNSFFAREREETGDLRSEGRKEDDPGGCAARGPAQYRTGRTG